MFDVTNWAYAGGKPESAAVIKSNPDDFQVNEKLGFELSGEGEHLYLYIEKRGLTTEELVKALAACLNKPAKAISYAGLKDKHAVTRQWICVHSLHNDVAEPDSLAGEGWRVLASQRHLKKLKTGVLAANGFQLILRAIDNPEDVEARLQRVRYQGVPNYFGDQRFGSQNLEKAWQLLTGNYRVKNPFLRGMYYSAARSFLFNHVLSARVDQMTWNRALAGDVMQLGGTHSIFTVEDIEEGIQQRIDEWDISPAGPLWGEGKERASLAALAIQQQALEPYADWCQGLEAQGLQRAWRPFVLAIKELNWLWLEPDCLQLQFELPPGSYATSVVRELTRCPE
ncbi:tRNA pseudouridine(13) synthase TruD [Legionella taurinensis]|uniref:tRNA pseudouridine synthase D n=1 Tax=Legionella taurinensis TaxID=70611 RepID=A0A3A5L0R7_9GAMM|nr:tRNA pseudouridine(13) synthase TruD [Legionella taurinensis]RJT43664.1 tRNA pseudouridine(13) synthase TruD [Legionella taurinensis]RJT64773.1 tRNA pseudouridine(13) synthase TruD [Legionella taurinensis]STY26609.1 hydrogenase [Legionella taurinensis]